MARRRSNNRSGVPPVEVFVPVRSRVPSALSMLEDRRTFHPMMDMRPARSFFTRPRLVIHDPNVNKTRVRSSRMSSRIAFDVPHHVAICVRRKQRSEVLHALSLTGRGSGSGRKRRNYWSDVSC